MGHEQEWATKHYGAPCTQANLKSVEIFGRTLAVHRKAAKAFRRIDRVFANTVPDYYRDICRDGDTGAYSCRVIAGTNLKSLHAWPLAIDIDWTENARDGDRDSEMRDRGMPAIRKLEAEGFVWGGRFSSPDDMHVQLGVEQTPLVLKARYTRDGKPREWYRRKLAAE